MSSHHPPVLHADETQSEPVKLSSYLVDPTAAYEHKPDLKSTVHAAANLAIDLLKESSDAFGPLKSVVGGLSTILKYCDVWYIYFAKSFTPLNFEPANEGEPYNDRISKTPSRRSR